MGTDYQWQSEGHFVVIGICAEFVGVLSRRENLSDLPFNGN